MHRFFLLPGLLALLSMSVCAQSDTLHIPSMKEVYMQNSWLAGNNPVGLLFNRFQSFSVAEANYSYNKGNLGNITLPSRTNTFSIYSEAFRKINKASLYGKIKYMQNHTQGMNWNGMINDYWQMINLCDSISGKRRTEQYQLTGAFSLPIRSHWLAGAQFNYLVESTAKDTDPRNKNQWMEWQFTPGIGYQNKQIRWGGSLLYANRKETIDYQNMGNHVTYPSFVAYPLGFFKTLSRDENVKWYYTSQEAGGALQLDFSRRQLQLFQQIGGSFTKQNIESNRIQNRKEGDASLWNVTYQSKLRKLLPSTRHEWELKASIKQSHHYDPLQQQEASGSWTYYGKVLRSTQQTGNYSIGYGYFRLRDIWHPKYSLSAGMNYHHAKTFLYFYPTEYGQLVRRLTMHTTFTRNYLLPHALLDFSLTGRYGTGSGFILSEKNLLSSDNAPNVKLWQNKSKLQQDFYYATQSRWSFNISITYTSETLLRWFIGLSAYYEQGDTNPSNINKQKINTSIGLIF